MEPCSFHERTLLIERHIQKLRKLKYDLILLEIKREKELLAIRELEKCLKRCRI